MTRDEIIKMAREAGFPFNKYGALKGDDYGEIDADEMFERFYALATEVERENCAMICETMTARPEFGLEIQDRMLLLAAKKIRARGEKGQS